MSSVETKFWGEDLDVTEALTPIAVMRQAAGQLPSITKQLLEAEIESGEADDQTIDFSPQIPIEHTFRIIAPALDRYASSLFVVQHDPMLVYPTRTSSLVYVDGLNGEIVDHTEGELRKTIRTILGSSAVKAIIYSLLAKINESRVSPR